MANANTLQTKIIAASELFDSQQVDQHLSHLLNVDMAWDILGELDSFLDTVKDNRQGNIHETAVLTGNIYIAPDAEVKAHALIEGPAWIGSGASVGHGSYLRGGVVLASGAKIGHSSEVKHALMLNDAQAPHFNYVGDAVVGCRVNLGAGVKLANFHTFGSHIKVAGVETGLRKFSAALGDDVSIGCNAVLAPGTIVGARSIVYNGAMLRGLYPADSVIKLRSSIQIDPRQ